jgi:hypothetical protein
MNRVYVMIMNKVSVMIISKVYIMIMNRMRRPRFDIDCCDLIMSSEEIYLISVSYGYI